MTVTATSDTPGVIPNTGSGAVSVSYTNPNATGTLTFAPVPGAVGTATITVTVTDNGSNVAPNVNSVSTSFVVTVTPVNQKPTLDPFISPGAINENSGMQTINLSGITAGMGENQFLTVTATSGNIGLIPAPSITYNSPDTSGYLSYTPTPNVSGTSVITVTVTDNGATGGANVNTVSQTFLVTVLAVNQAPTLNVIPNPPALPVNAVSQTVNLAGISPGAGDQGQILTITATSDNPDLIPNPIPVTYTQGATVASLTYVPVMDASGTATITVTVTDSGPTDNGGINTVSRTFTVAVTPANPGPVVGATAANLAYIQGAAATVIDPGVTVTDAGSSNIVSTTVSIVTNFARGQDLLSFVNAGGITGTYDAAHGILSLNGIATPALYQAALRTVRYSNTSSNPSTLNRIIQFQVNDGAASNNFGAATRTITVTAVNQAPTLNLIPDPAPIYEKAGTQVIDLGGITAGAGASQTLTITATSSNTALIPNPTVSYVSPAGTGSIAYTPAAALSGSAVISVTVTDNGGTANGGVASVTQRFTVVVLPVNQPPQLATIATPAAILENAGPQNVNLTGITSGAGDPQQFLTITAVSSNPALIPNPVGVSYTSPNATASLSYTPVPFTSGTASIIVTIQDDGGTANGGVYTVSQAFTVTVTPVNQQPTLDPITDPTPVNENTITSLSPAMITLTGISAGKGDKNQLLSLTAVSNNPGLIPNPTIIYTNGNSTGVLSYTPRANTFGSAVITVTVTDNGNTANNGVNAISRSFTVVIKPINLQPTLSVIPNPAAINEINTAPANPPLVTINLTGISAGPGETQNIFITATSSNTNLINPTVNYTSPNATGTITYTPALDAFGSAVITVTVMDDGGTANAGVDTLVRMFTVNVTHINQVPTLDLIPDSPILPVDADQQQVNLTGIGPGLGDAGQSLKLTVTSSNPSLILATPPALAPKVVYTNPSNRHALLQPEAGRQRHGGDHRHRDRRRRHGQGRHQHHLQSFTVTVQPLNHAPTINVINPITLIENSGQQTINLSGITDGDGGTQTVTPVTATSNNPGLIPNPVITYTNPNTTGMLTYTPVPGNTGTATITVTVTDNGGTANGGVNTFTATFVITVTPVNQLAHARPDPHPRADLRERPAADDQPDGHQRRRQHDAVRDRHRREQQPGPDPQPHGHLHQPRQPRHAHVHAGGQHQRHGQRSPSR